MQRSSNARTTLLAVGAALALTVAAPALASASSSAALSAASSSGGSGSLSGDESALPQRCVTHVDTGIIACEGDGVTLDQARAAAAGGSSVNGTTAPGRMTRLAAVHVATIYSGFLGQGGSLEINASSGCTSSTSGVEWQLGNVGSMNDRTSSVRVYAGCRVQLFDRANCPSGSGRFPSSGWAGTTYYVGDAMNDRTSCVRGT